MSTELARIRLVRQRIEEAEDTEKASGSYCAINHAALAAIRKRREERHAADACSEKQESSGEYCIVYRKAESQMTSPAYAVDDYTEL
jgi:hypothetical protein